MSKKKSSSNKKDDEKNIDISEEQESASIPLEDYEKRKDDYLRIAADTGKPLFEKNPDHEISKIFKEIANKIKGSFL